MSKYEWIKVTFAADCEPCECCGEPLCEHGEQSAAIYA